MLSQTRLNFLHIQSSWNMLDDQHNSILSTITSLVLSTSIPSGNRIYDIMIYIYIYIYMFYVDPPTKGLTKNNLLGLTNTNLTKRCVSLCETSKRQIFQFSWPVHPGKRKIRKPIRPWSFLFLKEMTGICFTGVYSSTSVCYLGMGYWRKICWWTDSKVTVFCLFSWWRFMDFDPMGWVSHHEFSPQDLVGRCFFTSHFFPSTVSFTQIQDDAWAGEYALLHFFLNVTTCERWFAGLLLIKFVYFKDGILLRWILAKWWKLGGKHFENGQFWYPWSMV